MRSISASIGSWRSGTSSSSWGAVCDNFPQLRLLLGFLKVDTYFQQRFSSQGASVHIKAAPAKRSQHFNTKYRSIVRRSILSAFGLSVNSNLIIFNNTQHVATGWPNTTQQCCVELLRSFGRGLKLFLEGVFV